MKIKSQLPLILITAFLDVVGLAIFIPVIPEIIESFGIASSWSGYSQGIYALGMFLWGLVFGRWSDQKGRKKILSFTSLLNLLSYILLLYSLWNIGESTWVAPTNIWQGFTFFSLVFLFSRFIGGLWWAGYGVTQAYISDISTPESRTKNFGLMGAAFGVWFLVGPALWALFSELIGIKGTILACIGVIFLNVLAINFLLEEPKKHSSQDKVDFFEKFHFSKDVIVLFSLTFWATVAFSSIQGMSPQYYKDVFSFTPKEIGYTMSVVWLVSILYQGWLVRYVRKYLDEVSMVRFAFLILLFGFIGFSLNTSPHWLYFWVIFFPLGMGSFHPSVSSLLGRKAGNEVGKVMGYNTSIASIGQIVGPVLMGSLYALDQVTFFWFSHFVFPFFAALVIFGLLFVISLTLLKRQ